MSFDDVGCHRDEPPGWEEEMERRDFEDSPGNLSLALGRAREGEMDLLMTCDGCGEPGADEQLWLSAPLGLCVVRVHRVRSCAEQARVARGGGRFETDGEPEPPPPAAPVDERMMRAAREYAVEWRRTHSSERGRT